MKYGCYQESFVIHDWFVIGFLVVKCAACQSRKSERVLKSHAILALLDSFSGAASRMVGLSNYCI